MKKAADFFSVVAFSDGMMLAKKLGISSYLECSALTRKGVDDLFDEATRISRKNAAMLAVTNNMTPVEKRCCDVV